MSYLPFKMAAPSARLTNDEENSCTYRDEEDEELVDVISQLANIEPFDTRLSNKRPVCERCKRPLSVCWCPYLPCEVIQVATTVWILQHPCEESRCLRTAPILYHSLAPGRCRIFRGKKFSKERFPDVWKILNDSSTLLLYPCPDATLISNLPCSNGLSSHNLVILDGTWPQAKGLFAKNPALWKLKKVQIHHEGLSKYVIRSQPTDSCLSTLETAAVALSVLESNPALTEVLTRPLVALCDFQLSHGAVRHDSKECQIRSGTYHRRLPRSALVRRALASEEQSDL